MMKLPEKPESIFAIIADSFRSYVQVYKQIFLLTLAVAVLHLLNGFIVLFDPYVGTVASILITFVGVYFYGAMLYAVQMDFMGEPKTFLEALTYSKSRYLPMLAGLLIWFLYFILFGVFGFAIGKVATILHIAFFWHVFLSVAMIYLLFLWYFSMPLIILDKFHALTAFLTSSKLVFMHWWRVCLVMGFVAFVAFALFQIGFYFISFEHPVWLVIYNFILVVVIYPAFITATLLLLNDLKIRYHLTHEETQ